MTTERVGGREEERGRRRGEGEEGKKRGGGRDGEAQRGNS